MEMVRIMAARAELRETDIFFADLRQDMLTLQIIGIMDSQWKADGLDLRHVLCLHVFSDWHLLLLSQDDPLWLSVHGGPGGAD